MKIAILSSHEELRCVHCGGLPVIHSPVLNQSLEADVFAVIDNKIEQKKWYEQKKHLRLTKNVIKEISAELRGLTRF